MMVALPENFAWLRREPAPRMLVEALKLYGVTETPGPSNNPNIMSWADEVGPDVRKIYSGDAIAWCGLFMAVVAKRAGKPLPHSPLWALSWATWGTASPQPMLGDVMVFSRAGGGHVALYVGEANGGVYILGGNQSDQVNIRWKPKTDLVTARRLYVHGVPANVRRVTVNGTGIVSTKES